MAEGWTCARCAAENDSWAVGCASCGTVRPDLSVAGWPPESPGPQVPTPAVPPTETSPTEPAPADPAPAFVGWPPVATGQPGEISTPAPAVGFGYDVATPPPPAPVPLWKRVPIGLIVVGVFVIGGAVAGLLFQANRSSSGEITGGGDVDAVELRVGDCFDLKDPSAEEVNDVNGVPCTDEHEYETFFVGSMPGGEYPTEDSFGAWLDDNCVPAFETYVGTSYDNSELEIFWLSPTAAAWDVGDRSIQCSLYHPRIHRLSESLKGSAR